MTHAERRKLVEAPLPTARIIAGKSWAGVLINRDTKRAADQSRMQLCVADEEDFQNLCIKRRDNE